MAKRLPSNKKINVLLLQRIKNLWDMYDTVAVAPIYAKNVLLPQWMARIADSMAYNDLKGKIEKHQKTTAHYVSNIEEFFAKLWAEDLLTITRKVNEKNTLYASVHESDVSDLIQKIYNISIDEHHLKLAKKIDTLGKHNVMFDFKGLQKEITIDVVAEEVQKPTS